MLVLFAKISGNSGENKVWKSHKKRSPAIALDSLGELPYLNDVAPTRSGTRNSIKQEYYIPAYSSCWKVTRRRCVKACWSVAPGCFT